MVIDREAEGNAETLCCLSAHDHAAEKDLKIIHHGALLRVDLKRQRHGLVIR